MTAQVPAGFVRMGSGRIVPASAMSNQQKAKPRKFLLVLQFYEGDRESAEQLASLIADLERVRNREVDVLLFRRADCRELSPQIVAKLQTKFDKVILQACRRIDAKGHPFGPNQMWSDLMTMMSQIPPFATDYYALLNLEPDATPTRPGWLGELIAGWKAAMSEGKSVIGYIHDNPVTHLNGVAVWAADTYRRAGGNTLAGGSPQVPYDIRHRATILPMAKETPLIYFEYRKPTITPEELFRPRKDGIVPALWHGVKDGSARAAVRARHITFTDRGTSASEVVSDAVKSNNELIKGEIYEKLGVAASIRVEESVPNGQIQESAIHSVIDHIEGGVFPHNMGDTIRSTVSSPTKRPNVYTYYQGRGRQSIESQAIIDLWKNGWTSRGWNPVVLTLRQAATHPKFDEFQTRIERLPFVGDSKDQLMMFNRWLALDMAGAGLMTDNDVLPGAFTPADVVSFDVGLVLSPRESQSISAALFDAPNLAKFIDAIQKYDAKPEDVSGKRPHVSDMTVWLSHAPDAVEPTVNTFGTDNVVAAKLMKFSNARNTGNVSADMEKFLQLAPA